MLRGIPYALVCLFAVACTSVASGSGAGSFEVYRAAHYDIGDEQRGTRVAALGLRAALNPGFVQLPQEDPEGDSGGGEGNADEDIAATPERKRRRRRRRRARRRSD